MLMKAKIVYERGSRNSTSFGALYYGGSNEFSEQK